MLGIYWRGNMGVLSRTFQSNAALVDGYPLEGTIYYIYCDQCGSFNVRTHLKLIQWLLLILTALIIAVCWNYILVQELHGKEIYICWTICFFFTAGIIGLFYRYFPHKCMKCGNTNITYQDTLGYSKDGAHYCIDVPEHSLHKHNEEKMEFCRDVKVFLLIIVFMFLAPLFFLFGILKEGLDFMKEKRKNHDWCMRHLKTKRLNIKMPNTVSKLTVAPPLLLTQTIWQ